MSRRLANLPPELLRRRLAALVVSQGVRFNELSKRLGKSAAWAYQRLSETWAKSRPAATISEADLAEIVAATGIDVKRLRRPVIYLCDYAAMADLLTGPRLVRAAKDGYGRVSVKRMLCQDLIREEDGRYRVTDAGREALERHAAKPKSKARQVETMKRVRRFARQFKDQIYLNRGLLWLVEGDTASQVVADTGTDPVMPTPGVGPLRRKVTAWQNMPVFSGEPARPQTVDQIVSRLCRPGEAS